MNTVICKSCKNYDSHLSDCAVWIENCLNPETTTMQMNELMKELGNKPFFEDEEPRQCKHFSGKYLFIVGD